MRGVQRAKTIYSQCATGFCQIPALLMSQKQPTLTLSPDHSQTLQKAALRQLCTLLACLTSQGLRYSLRYSQAPSSLSSADVKCASWAEKPQSLVPPQKCVHSRDNRQGRKVRRPRRKCNTERKEQCTQGPTTALHQCEQQHDR